MKNYRFTLTGAIPYIFPNPVKRIQAQSLDMAMASLAESITNKLKGSHYSIQRLGKGVWSITVDTVKIATFRWFFEGIA